MIWSSWLLGCCVLYTTKEDIEREEGKGDINLLEGKKQPRHSKL